VLILLGVHALLAAAAMAWPRAGRHAPWLCALAPAAALGWLALRAGPVLDGRPLVERAAWVPQLGLELGFRLDGFGLLMGVLVAGVGALVLVYSHWYLGADRPDLGRFCGYLTAFAGAMLGLVLADNLFVLYVCWELTSITSYLLIGFEDERADARRAALQALLVTSLGGLAMLGGLVLLGQAAGTWSLAELVARPPRGPAAEAGLALVLVGAFAKSAQVPLHGWLPAAMAAPTPVSAYLHAAAMVKAGVYLIARLATAFAPVGWWRPVVVGVGLATMLLGGWRALRQHDLKLLLAYGTVGQLGFLVVLFGLGLPEATVAGATLLLAHALFKATLFLVTGVVDHQAGTRDLRRLAGLGRRLPGLAAVAAAGAASMAGLPPLLGYLAKEEAYDALGHPGGTLGPLVLAGVVAGSVLTVAYSARFLHGGFADRPGQRAEVPRPATGFVLPAALLAAAGLALGVLPGLASQLIVPAARALDPAVPGEALTLWHGLTPALGLSALTLAAGAGLFQAREAVARAQARLAPHRGVEEAYRGGLLAFLRGAAQVTGLVQSGSLPVYLGTILLTVLALPGAALAGDVLGWPGPGGPARLDGLELADSPVQVAVGLLVAVAAVGAAAARRRLAAVLLLGAVGYGAAVLFVIQGAPDLALTQFLVETLSLVAFVLALRHLPDRFTHRRWRLGRASRVAVSAGVGLFVAGFALLARGARSGAAVSDAYLEQAEPEAGAGNVVNAILVDFRGFDTLGEITVLTAAGLGVISMVVLGRRVGSEVGGVRPRRDAPGDADTPPSGS
jgi:multicomponent Na+:H+ antiporter subunit A